MSNKTGFFIVVEGLDGSGKTIMTEVMTNKLNEFGVPAEKTREIGGTPVGEGVRQLLFNPTDGVQVETSAKVLLVLAGRLQHLHTKIMPKIRQGINVVCDRWHDSTHAYQGSEDGGLKTLMEIEKLHFMKPVTTPPDYFIWLDIDVDTALERQTSRGKVDNDLYKFNRDLTIKVNAVYQQRIKRYQVVGSPTKFIRIDASGTVDEVKVLIAEAAARIAKDYIRK